MREIDEIHNAEHKRQSGGEQKQQNAELQAVEQLGENKTEMHGEPLFDYALAVIRVGMIQQRHTNFLHTEMSRIFRHLEHVIILNRQIVGIKAKRSTHRAKTLTG